METDVPASRRWMILKAVGAILVACTASACGAFCPTRDGLQVTPRPSPQLLPYNTWVSNPKLENFLREAIRSRTLESVKSKYGFDCKPMSAEAACADCYECKAVIPQFEENPSLWNARATCDKAGEMSVIAWLGPGSQAKAMTYWRR